MTLNKSHVVLNKDSSCKRDVRELQETDSIVTWPNNVKTCCEAGNTWRKEGTQQVNNKTIVYLRAGKDRMRLHQRRVEKEIRTGMSIIGSRIQKVICSLLT
jgi:hypothetical protein